MANKKCNRCQETKDVSEFTKNSATRDGLKSLCRACSNAYSRDWFSSQTSERRRAKLLRNGYGLTVDDFDALLAAQGGQCAVCGTAEPGGQFGTWHIDHDHSCCPKTGANRKSCGNCIRGLLCQKCNVGLGQFDDDPDRLLAAATYVLKTQNLLVNHD